MIANVLKESLPYVEFPSSTFELAFKKALFALLEDAEVSTYTPSPGNEDAFDFLGAVIDDLRADEEDANEVSEEAKKIEINLDLFGDVSDDDDSDDDDDDDDDEFEDVTHDEIENEIESDEEDDESETDDDEVEEKKED